jgi:hypothetical protein
MGVKHKFVSSVADVGGGTYVQPTHWNDTHKNPPFMVLSDAAASGLGWTNQPSAYTEFLGVARNRTWFDFSNVDLVRMAAGIGGSIGFASAQLMAQFSPDDGVNWYPLATGATGPFVGLGSGAIATGINNVKVGSWFSINPSAVAAGSAGVHVRVMGFMGDGAADPWVTGYHIFVL